MIICQISKDDIFFSSNCVFQSNEHELADGDKRVDFHNTAGFDNLAKLCQSVQFICT